MEFDYIDCGDCLELMKEIPDKSIDLIITDPPYEIATTTTKGKTGAFGSTARSFHNEIRPLTNGISNNVLDEFVRVMKKVNIYIWCNKEQILQYMEYFKNYNMDLITWHKTNPVPTCNNKYLSDTEYLLFFREKGVSVYGSYATKKKYYVTPTNKADKDKYGHPTIKPLEIIQNLIVNSSQEGDIILDPFLGSGTTAVAAVNTGRHYIGFELNEEYFDVACQRLDEAEQTKFEEKLAYTE